MHELPDRLQQAGTDGHPVAHRLPGQFHPVAAEDAFLAVQRQMVGVLADGHLSQQPRPWQPFLDRLGQAIGDDDVPLTALARVLGPYVLNHDHTGRHVLELLADLLTDLDPKRAAVGTGKLLGGDVVEFAPAAGRRAAACDRDHSSWPGSPQRQLAVCRPAARFPEPWLRLPPRPRGRRARAGRDRSSRSCGRSAGARAVRAGAGACR